MKASEFITEAKATKTRLDPKCWSGKKIGNPKTKVKGGVRVNNCVPAESVELDEISRRDFLKGAGATAGLAAMGAPGQAKASDYRLTESDWKMILLGCYFVNIPANYLPHRGPQAAIRNQLLELGPFIGQDLQKDIDSIGAKMQANPEYITNILKMLNDMDDQINLANRISEVRTRVVRGMSPEERRYHMNRLGIKENNDLDKELLEEFDLIESNINMLAERNGVDAEAIWEDLENLTDDELYVFAATQPVMEDWQKANKKDRTAGMSQKAVNAYRRENPGSKLKTAVTTKPSKLKKGSKASKRRKSYCSRSRGQMKMHNISCAKTPDKAICAARRRWNCE